LEPDSNATADEDVNQKNKNRFLRKRNETLHLTLAK